VFAEFERSMIRERVMAGLSRAKADGIQLGRRRLEDSDADKVAAIVAARAKGTGIRRIARELGVSVVPDRFELAFAEGDQTRSCEVIWRHGKICGVKFAS
jgi:hypothetical protein